LPKEKRFVVPFEFEGEMVVSEHVFGGMEKEDEALVEGWTEVESVKWNTQGKFEGLGRGFF